MKARMLAAALPLLGLLSGPLESGPAPGGAPGFDGPAILVRARRLHPVSAAPIDGGQVLIVGGKISQVGRDLKAPAEAEVIDVAGDLFPGLIDGGAPLGIPGSPAEEFSELTPEVRAVHGLDRDSRSLDRALRSGVTAFGLTPGSRNVIGGLGAVVKTAPRLKAGDIVVADSFLQASLGEEAFAGNLNLRAAAPTSYYHRLPNTRMGTAFLLRRAFFEALDLGRPEGLSLSGETGMIRLLAPEGKAVLAETLRGKRPLVIDADERQEIEAALRISEEFDAKIVILGFGEGADLIGRVKAKGHKVLIAPGWDLRAERREDFRGTPLLAALLDSAGVDFAFASGDPRAVERLRERLGFTVRFGLDPERALRAATLGAARILGAEGRLGSIEPGKDADLVAVRGGGPLDAASAVEWVMVEGRILTFGSQKGRRESL